MPKPIPYLVDTIGIKPTLLSAGTLSLGGVTLSTASSVVGVFALLATTGVLPNALTSLGLAGGIAFTAAGSVGFFASAGFFVFVAICVRNARHTSLRQLPSSSVNVLPEPIEVENEGTDEKLFAAYQQLVQAMGKAIPEETYNNFVYLAFWKSGEIYLDLTYRIEGSTLILGNQKPIVLKKDLGEKEFMDGFIAHLKRAFPEISIEPGIKPHVLILNFKKKEDNA